MLEEEKTVQRHRYQVSKELTHDQFYSWLAARIGLTTTDVENWIGRDAILGSTDPHLNDIPLKRWDALHPLVLSYARSCAGGPFGWSLCESVCCLKALAQQVLPPKERRS